MVRYIVVRLIQAIFTAIGVIVLVFFMLRLTGDPTTAILPKEASIETRANLREEMGLNRPLYEQLFDYLGDAISGDFGLSYVYRLPATTLLLERLPATVELALAGLALAVLIGVPIGVLGAAYPGTIWKALSNAIGILGLSTPPFWAGMILMLVFSVTLGLFPVAGRSGARSLVLPAITMSLASVGQVTRITQAAMLEVLRQDYMLVARAKGLRPWIVNFRHALRNATIPVITLVGILFGYMLGGSIIVETVFSWPGVGWLTYQAVQSRDFVLVQAVTIFISWVVLTLSIATDILYGVLDPRVSYDR